MFCLLRTRCLLFPAQSLSYSLDEKSRGRTASVAMSSSGRGRIGDERPVLSRRFRAECVDAAGGGDGTEDRVRIGVQVDQDSAVDGCGSRSVESVVRGQSESERASGVVDADTEFAGEVLNGVRNFDVSLATVQRD